MKAVLRIRYALVVAACAWQALLLSSSLCGQNASTAGERVDTRLTETTEEAISESRPGGPDGRVLVGYESFVGSLHQDYLDDQKALADGKVPDNHRWRNLGIREDEEQSVRSLAFDAWNRLDEWWKYCLPIWKKPHHRGDPPPGDEAKPCSGENGQKNLIIDREFILSVKQALGEEAFKKVDGIVRSDFMTTPDQTPIRDANSKSDSGGTTAPEVQK